MIVFLLFPSSLTCEAVLDATVPGVETGNTNDDTVDDAATTNVAVAVKPHIMSTRKGVVRRVCSPEPRARIPVAPPPSSLWFTSRCL